MIQRMTLLLKEELDLITMIQYRIWSLKVMTYCMQDRYENIYKIDISNTDAISETPYISFTK